MRGAGGAIASARAAPDWTAIPQRDETPYKTHRSGSRTFIGREVPDILEPAYACGGPFMRVKRRYRRIYRGLFRRRLGIVIIVVLAVQAATALYILRLSTRDLALRSSCHLLARSFPHITGHFLATRTLCHDVGNAAPIGSQP